MENQTEEWRTVIGAHAYEVSSIGRVRRMAGTYGCRNGRVMRQKEAKGYLVIALSLGAKGKYRHVGVHMLMCEAFLGPRPSLNHQVAHGNGVRSHNVISNLRWATARENAKDRDEHGKTFLPKGSLHPMSKLTEDAVIKMRSMKSGGANVGDLAREFCVSRWTVFDALSGRTWGHV